MSATLHRDTFMMSWPRPDWKVRGGANFKSRTFGDTSPRGAMTDWLSIARAIEDAGGRVLVMPPAADRNLTGLPYTAEAGVFHRDPSGAPCWVLPRMTPPHRRDEALLTSGFVSALGWGPWAPEARWEAQGDALRIDEARTIHTWGVGPMARTEPEAYAEVAEALSAEHVHIRFNADPWFHGNTLIAIYWAPGTGRPLIVVTPDALTSEELEKLRAFAEDADFEFIDRAASLGYTTNALQVGSTVIAPAGLSDNVRGIWRELGLTVVELQLNDLFHRGGGAAVCLTNRLWGLRPDEVPAQLWFSAQRESLEAMAARYPEQIAP